MIPKVDGSTVKPNSGSHGSKKLEKLNVTIPKNDEIPKNDLNDKVVTNFHTGETLSESFFRNVNIKESYILHSPTPDSYIKKEAISSILRNVDGFVDIIINKIIKEISGIVSVYESDKKNPISEEKVIENKKAYEIQKKEIGQSEEVIKTNNSIMADCIVRFKRESNVIDQFHSSCEDRLGKAIEDHTWLKKYCSQNYVPNDLDRLSEKEKTAFEIEKGKYFIEKEFLKAPFETDNILMLSDRITVFRQRINRHYYEIKNLPEESYANKIHQFYHNILEQFKKDYDRELPSIKDRKDLLQSSIKDFERDIKRLDDKNNELKSWLNKAESLIKDREERINLAKLKPEGTTGSSWLPSFLGGSSNKDSVSPGKQPDLQGSSK